MDKEDLKEFRDDVLLGLPFVMIIVGVSRSWKYLAIVSPIIVVLMIFIGLLCYLSFLFFHKHKKHGI